MANTIHGTPGRRLFTAAQRDLDPLGRIAATWETSSRWKDPPGCEAMSHGWDNPGWCLFTWTKSIRKTHVGSMSKCQMTRIEFWVMPPKSDIFQMNNLTNPWRNSVRNGPKEVPLLPATAVFQGHWCWLGRFGAGRPREAPFKIQGAAARLWATEHIRRSANILDSFRYL